MERYLQNMLRSLDDMNKNIYKVKLRYQQKGSSSRYRLYLDLYHKGERQYKGLEIFLTGEKNRDENNFKRACKIRHEFQEIYDKDPDGFQFEEKKKKEFIQFFEDMAKKKKDKNYRLSFNNFRQFYPKDELNFKDIDYNLCLEFKEHLLGEVFGDHTASHYFTCFKSCLNEAVRRGTLDKNPAAQISISYQENTRERLYPVEVKKLWETPCDYNDLKNGFLFSCYTGLRLSDINNLEFDDIHNGEIKVLQNKTLNEVEIPLIPITLKILSSQREKMKEDQKVFHIPDGGKTSSRMKQWMLDAGIKRHVTFHCARHTFGCMLVEEGNNLFVVKKLMGHKNIQTTMRYVDKANVDAKKAMSTLPNINL